MVDSGWSVVLASRRASSLAGAAIDALRQQSASAGAELIVARAWDDEAEALADSLHGCRVVRCDAQASIPDLRGMGLAAARGEWVALTEDNCLADPGWLTALQLAAKPGVHVLGGAMGNARSKRAVDWGAYFAEYGFFGPDRRGTPPLVTGANVAYARAVVEDVAAWAIEGSWEDVIHARLAARGLTFSVVPDAWVRQNLTYGILDFCRDRWEHGHDYARVRSRQASPFRRAAFLAGAPLLPGLLAWRVWRSAGRTAPGAFLRGLPATLTFLGAWSLGEAAGYLKGKNA
jgi:hypothetical protein